MNSEHYDIRGLWLDHSSGFSKFPILHAYKQSGLDNFLCTFKTERTYKTNVGAYAALQRMPRTINDGSKLNVHYLIARLHDGSYIGILGIALKSDYEIVYRY